MKVRMAITGTAPLMMHNIRLADPLDPIAKAMKSISGKRKKTDDDLEQLARLEFEGGLYCSPVVGPYLPGINIERSLVEGAKISKMGKAVTRGLFVLDDEVPLVYKGPRTVDELWADPTFRSTMAVRVQQSRVMRTRPIFRNWALDVDAEVDPGILNLETVSAIATDTGNMVGIGEFRPRYGRFEVIVEAI